MIAIQGRNFKRQISELSSFSSNRSISSQESFAKIANSSSVGTLRKKTGGLFRCKKFVEQEQKQEQMDQKSFFMSTHQYDHAGEDKEEYASSMYYYEAAVKIEMWKAQQACEDITEFRKLKKQLREKGCVTSAGLTALLDNRAQERLQQFNASRAA